MRVRERAWSCAVRGTARPSSVRRDVCGEDGAPGRSSSTAWRRASSSSPAPSVASTGVARGEAAVGELPDADDAAGTPDTASVARGVGAWAGVKGMGGAAACGRCGVRGRGEQRRSRGSCAVDVGGEGRGRRARRGGGAGGGGDRDGGVASPPRSTGSRGEVGRRERSGTGGRGSTEGSSPTMTGIVPSTAPHVGDDLAQARVAHDGSDHGERFDGVEDRLDEGADDAVVDDV